MSISKKEAPTKGKGTQARPGVEHNYHDYANTRPEDVVLMFPSSNLGSMRQHNPLACGIQQQGFAVKLHYMLSDIEADGKTSIVSWAPHGRCFLVHDRKSFVDHILPSYFLQSTFASFQRQLNLYGFRRISSSQDKGGYYHELFLRSKPELASYIQRIKRKGSGPRKPDSPESEPSFYAMPYLPPTRSPAPASSHFVAACFPNPMMPGAYQGAKPAAVQVLTLRGMVPALMQTVPPTPPSQPGYQCQDPPAMPHSLYPQAPVIKRAQGPGTGSLTPIAPAPARYSYGVNQWGQPAPPHCAPAPSTSTETVSNAVLQYQGGGKVASTTSLTNAGGVPSAPTIGLSDPDQRGTGSHAPRLARRVPTDQRNSLAMTAVGLSMTRSSSLQEKKRGATASQFEDRSKRSCPSPGASFVDRRGDATSDNFHKSSHAPNHATAPFVDTRGASSGSFHKSSHVSNHANPAVVEETRRTTIPVPGLSNNSKDHGTVSSSAFNERNEGSVASYGISAANASPFSFGSDLANPQAPRNSCMLTDGDHGMLGREGTASSRGGGPCSPSSIMAYGQTSGHHSCVPDRAAYNGGRPMPPKPLIVPLADFENKAGTRVTNRLVAGQQVGPSPNKRAVFFPVPPEDSTLLPTTTALSRSSSGSLSPTSWHNAFGEEDGFWCQRG